MELSSHVRAGKSVVLGWQHADSADGLGCDPEMAYCLILVTIVNSDQSGVFHHTKAVNHLSKHSIAQAGG